MIFESEAAFYAARGGELSRESDYGVWWTDDVPFPRYRVSYVKDTGDVYAVNQSTRVVEVLGTVEPIECLDTDFNVDWDAPLDAVLEGWTDACGPTGGLEWLRDRLHAHPVKPVDLGDALAATLVSNDNALD